MKWFSPLFLLLLFTVCTSGQFFRNAFRGFQGFQRGIHEGFHNVMRPFHHIMHMMTRGHHFSSSTSSNSIDSTGGTSKPVATGKDELFPRDCGRNKKGKGNLCFPDGKLCQERVSRSGNVNFGGHLYWLSWQSTDPQLSNTKWDWFNARNYCRKRCMDLVSFETKQEYDFIKSQMGGVKYFWTSGRLCDFDGCDRPDFRPKNINGWFWSANQARLAPTNSTSAFHDWSFTGGFNPPRRQPDNREQIQQNGETESCMAVLNNFYGDGIKWHDVACHHEKPVVCEDVEGHIAFARQNFPNLRIP